MDKDKKLQEQVDDLRSAFVLLVMAGQGNGNLPVDYDDLLDDLNAITTLPVDDLKNILWLGGYC